MAWILTSNPVSGVMLTPGTQRCDAVLSAPWARQYATFWECVGDWMIGRDDLGRLRRGMRAVVTLQAAWRGRLVRADSRASAEAAARMAAVSEAAASVAAEAACRALEAVLAECAAAARKKARHERKKARKEARKKARKAEVRERDEEDFQPVLAALEQVARLPPRTLDRLAALASAVSEGSALSPSLGSIPACLCLPSGRRSRPNRRRSRRPARRRAAHGARRRGRRRPRCEGLPPLPLPQ